eukprot:5984854-Pyramimonas_sp.AAC.1
MPGDDSARDVHLAPEMAPRETRIPVRRDEAQKPPDYPRRSPPLTSRLSDPSTASTTFPRMTSATPKPKTLSRTSGET